MVLRNAGGRRGGPFGGGRQRNGLSQGATNSYEQQLFNHADKGARDQRLGRGGGWAHGHDPSIVHHEYGTQRNPARAHAPAG